MVRRLGLKSVRTKCKKKGKGTSKVEVLQKKHEERMQKIDGLKKRIESTASLLQQQEDYPEEQFQALCEEYKNMKAEYDSLLANDSAQTKQ
ncbi:hypothetical protein RJ641_007293 [Dillenia turbinata]|uniref:Uncharacterized protein n=1 Tax=Dillenia turbinata TaxID=194707 RepID=A0AAN8Z3X3_9MAGN